MRKFMLLFCLLGPFRLAQADMSATDLFKEALYLENTSRDLDAAAHYYEKVGAREDAPADLKAKALVRLGHCRSLRGEIAQAKTAWTTVVDTYPNQMDSVREARMRLQDLALQERPVEKVIMSTPIVKVIRELAPTRMELEFLNFGVWMKDLPSPYVGGSLSYFLRPDIAFGLRMNYHFTYEDYVSGYNTYLSTRFWTLNPFVTVQKPLMKWLGVFVSGGPSLHRFHWDVEENSTYYSNGYYYGGTRSQAATEWIPGLNGRAGLSLGLSKGLALSLGYEWERFLKKTATFNTARGEIGGYTSGQGPFFSLSLRW